MADVTESFEAELVDYFKCRIGVQINSKDNLFEAGALDSFNILELLIFIETKLDVLLNPEDITSDNFGSIEAIVNLLWKQE